MGDIFVKCSNIFQVKSTLFAKYAHFKQNYKWHMSGFRYSLLWQKALQIIQVTHLPSADKCKQQNLNEDIYVYNNMIL